MRRPPIKSLVATPEPPPGLPELLDRLQVAAVKLGEAKSRGSDYARAVASADVTKARQAVDAEIRGELAAPLLAELGGSLPEQANG